jgi:hypothetical protein
VGIDIADAVTATPLLAMGAGLWVIVAVVVIGILVALFGWDRYGHGRKRTGGAGGYAPTDEVFVDPATGRRTRVWYDAATGEREYRPE